MASKPISSKLLPNSHRNFIPNFGRKVPANVIPWFNNFLSYILNNIAGFDLVFVWELSPMQIYTCKSFFGIMIFNPGSLGVWKMGEW